MTDRSTLSPTGALLAPYHAEVVAPLLDARWPGLPFAAGRLGSGSDVLGFDDDLSRDHDWGLRLTLLVPADRIDPVREHLAERLPEEFRGHPTRFPRSGAPSPVVGVEVKGVHGFLLDALGVDATSPLSSADWLSLTGQAVLEVTAGPVFEDRSGELGRARTRLRWYPDDVWLFTLASAWLRIEEELPFLGRSAARGDELGCRVLSARLVRGAMQLGFLLDRAWAPYPKWFGTAFAALPSAQGTVELLGAALESPSWQEREKSLGAALERLGRHQADRGLPVVDPVVQPFYERPFLSVGPMHAALQSAIEDPCLRAARLVGSVEQWADSAPALLDPSWRARAVAAWLGPV